MFKHNAFLFLGVSIVLVVLGLYRTVFLSGSIVLSSRQAEIVNSNFMPELLIVKSGSIVTWHNSDPIEQQVKSETYPDLVSGLIESNSKFSFTLIQKGLFDYYCISNPQAKGKIIVW